MLSSHRFPSLQPVSPKESVAHIPYLPGPDLCIRLLLYTEQAYRRAYNLLISDQQLSLAIGKAGQNVRLAAKLTGYGIDIKSESQIEDSAKPESDDETDIDDDMLVFSEDTDTQAETDADEVNE